MDNSRYEIIFPILAGIGGYCIHWWSSRVTKIEKAYEDAITYLHHECSRHQSYLFVFQRWGNQPKEVLESHLEKIRGEFETNALEISRTLAFGCLYVGDEAFQFYYNQIQGIQRNIGLAWKSQYSETYVETLHKLLQEYEIKIQEFSLLSRSNISKESFWVFPNLLCRGFFHLFRKLCDKFCKNSGSSKKIEPTQSKNLKQ